MRCQRILKDEEEGNKKVRCFQQNQTKGELILFATNFQGHFLASSHTVSLCLCSDASKLPSMCQTGGFFLCYYGPWCQTGGFEIRFGQEI